MQAKPRTVIPALAGDHDRYNLIFEKHCEEGGSSRNGSNQRLQAMSDTVLGAITEWLEENPDATQEAKTRLDLGYLTYTVLQFPPQSFPLLRFGIKLMSF